MIIWKLDAFFINSENNETSDPHNQVSHLGGKINLRKSDKCVATDKE